MYNFQLVTKPDILIPLKTYKTKDSIIDLNEIHVHSWIKMGLIQGH